MADNPLFIRLLRTGLLALATVLLVACGSTKVITADKSLVYRGNIYSLANVGTVGSRLEATTPGGEVIDVMRYDKRAFNALLDQHDRLEVRSVIALDEQDVLYEQKSVDGYRDFDRLQDDIGKVMRDIQKFMADAKKTQLKL